MTKTHQWKIKNLKKVLCQLDKCKTDADAWQLLHTIHLIVHNHPNLKNYLPSNVKRILYGVEQ
tara:strand:- start:201 stop:389 length:189 start_codon:yes stop_codon:yes gene_type:complete